MTVEPPVPPAPDDVASPFGGPAEPPVSGDAVVDPSAAAVLAGQVRSSAERRRRALALAIPATATLVADPLLGVLDTAVVGRIGAEQLGALGLSVAVLAALSWVFNFLVVGTTSTVARAVGADDLPAAGRRVTNAAVVAGGIGLTVAVFLLAAAPLLVRAFGAVDELVDPAVTYLRIRAVGVPFLLLGFVGHGAFRGVGDTRTPFALVVVANVVNAVLTVWLALGLDLGLAGAAWATVVAEAVVVVGFALRIRAAGLPLHPRDTAGEGVLPSGAEVRALVTVSRDLFLRTGGLVGGFLVITAAAARVDATTAAAHQVVWQAWILVAFFTDGLAIAAQTMIGTALGADNRVEARGVADDLVRFGLLVGVAIAVVMVALTGVLPGVLTDEPAVLAALPTAWVLAMVLYVVNGPVFVMDGILMAAEDYAFVRNWTAGPALVAALLAQVFVTAGGGLVLLWVAVTVMMVGRLVPQVLRLRSDAWMH